MNRIYLDACIAIYVVEKRIDYAERIENLINDLDVNDALCYSPLVRMECFVKPFREKDLVLQKLFESFFKHQEILEITAERFDKASQLRADFASLKTPDALHLATARHHNCTEFWTNDNRLNEVAPSLARNILLDQS